MKDTASSTFSFKDKVRKMGPAAIITSAFIGPGTIVTASLSGASFGYSLLWVVLLAVLALMVLMEMASRVGIAGGKDAVEAAVAVLPGNAPWKLFVKTIVTLGTLGICFAFEAGNIAGASLGLSDATSMPQWAAAALIAAVALSTVFLQSYKALARVMQLFVSVMVIVFIVSAVAVGPSLPGVMGGLLVPSMPEGSVVSALALVGTTLIGINLVLHSITSKEKWSGAGDVKAGLSEARFDIVFNILIGGLITMSVIVVSAAVLYGTGASVGNALVFTQSLEPVLGGWARIVGDVGLFAAGLSSAIAVPFTMRAILSSVFGWEKGSASAPARVLGVVVVIFGTVLAISGTSPAQIIVFAQATSGFILPFIAFLLLVAANNKKLLGAYANKPWQNAVGFASVALAFVLGINGLTKVVSKLFGA